MTARRDLRPALFLALSVLAAALGWLAWRMLPAPDTAPSYAGLRLTPMPTLGSASGFTLSDAQGRPRSMADYRGKVLVLYFGFVHCPEACPTELAKLAQVMKQLGPQAERVQVLLVTLDPERDTPELLDSYVRAFDPRFRGLSGTPAQIDAAARAFYVVYSRHVLPDGYTIDHSTGTYVVDVDGHRVLHAAAGTPIADLAHDIGQLLDGKL